MTPDSTTDQLQNKTLWSSYTEIIDVKQCYPNTALVGVQVDSEQFGSQQVSRNYHLRGRILQVPSNYNPQTRQYSGIWDGTFKPAYSNNMAWCLWDMLTHPRYGMGKRLGAADVDKWALYVIGQNCDQSVPDGFGGTEPRITCNAWLTTQRKAWDVLSDFCSAMRCMPIWNGQTLTFVQDRPSDKVWTYKGRFLNNINAVSKTDFADKRGMRYVRVNAPAGATSGKYYPVVVMRSAGSVSELASRVIITTATRTAGDPMNNCEFNGFVMPGGWTDRGRYAYGMFWQYQNNERAIHSIMMSNKGDDLRSVFYVDGAAFPVFAFIEDGLSISAPGADLVVNDTTYKFGATNPATECIAADVILDFKSGRGFYESHSLIVNDNLSCKKLFATDEIVARGGNQIRMIGGEYGALWRNDGAKTYLLLTNQGDVYGGWNTLRPFAIDNAQQHLQVHTRILSVLVLIRTPLRLVHMDTPSPLTLLVMRKTPSKTSHLTIL